MKEIIERLKELNKLDLQMQSLKKDMDRLPRELAQKEELPRGLRITIERAKSEIIRLKMEADAVELEVTSGEEALKRYAGQMNVLRTSKEFETVRRQMDAQRAWNKENEGKALELLEKVDGLKKDVEQNTKALEEAEKELAAETARVDKEVTELNSQYQALAKEREGLAQDVPDKELELYNRITASRGQAIATVERGICSACYMRIPAQVHNLALLAKELVVCPSCGRLLTATAS
jgi:predicted  nucleic acid-binding Zn-ribbon protein